MREGDAIAVDDLSWRVLETPGHSDCSISLHDAAERRAGDLRRHRAIIFPSPEDWWPNYFSGYAAYVASIERLAALDAEILCLSHNGAVVGRDDVREYFRRRAGGHAAVPRSHRGRDKGRQADPPTRRGTGRRDPPPDAGPAAGFLPEELRPVGQAVPEVREG